VEGEEGGKGRGVRSCQGNLQLCGNTLNDPGDGRGHPRKSYLFFLTVQMPFPKIWQRALEPF